MPKRSRCMPTAEDESIRVQFKLKTHTHTYISIIYRYNQKIQRARKDNETRVFFGPTRLVSRQMSNDLPGHRGRQDDSAVAAQHLTEEQGWALS